MGLDAIIGIIGALVAAGTAVGSNVAADSRANKAKEFAKEQAKQQLKRQVVAKAVSRLNPDDPIAGIAGMVGDEKASEAVADFNRGSSGANWGNVVAPLASAAGSVAKGVDGANSSYDAMDKSFYGPSDAAAAKDLSGSADWDSRGGYDDLKRQGKFGMGYAP